MHEIELSSSFKRDTHGLQEALELGRTLVLAGQKGTSISYQSTHKKPKVPVQGAQLPTPVCQSQSPGPAKAFNEGPDTWVTAAHWRLPDGARGFWLLA